MPWIEVEEPFAAAPRVASVHPQERWSGERGLLDDDELWVTGTMLTGVVFQPGVGSVVDASDCVFERCDLSRLRLRSLDACRFVDSKLVGADLGGATIDDVVFERCSFRYANLRGARLRRVRFDECTFDETDAYEIDLTDVGFDGSRLISVNVDRMRAVRVDLRGTTELGLEAAGRLDGCLVTEHQIPQLMYALAFASGLGVERSDRDL
ncbi:MAG: pentapeptide repeat-containing protein [Acidimicrobiia bacterium]|nr:pentapeptide repeat-containing protein [Acidimicrobiia bacterium]MDH5236178.1 pentapeptide repeat-containing protein [Acidimicrobiia bacterium]